MSDVGGACPTHSNERKLCYIYVIGMKSKANFCVIHRH